MQVDSVVAMKKLSAFLRDDSGVITIDWVMLTGAMIIGLVLVIAAFRGGVADLAQNFNASLSVDRPDIDTGTPPNP